MQDPVDIDLNNYLIEQDRLSRVYEDEAEARQEYIQLKAGEIMDKCNGGSNDVAFDAVTESTYATEALAKLIADYDVTKGAEENDKLTRDFLAAVQSYVEDYVEDNL